MKNIIWPLLFLISQGNTSEKVALWGHEIEFNPNISRVIFNSMPQRVKEMDLVADEYYKTGEFVYCKVDSNKVFNCAIYLDTDGNGELSSFYSNVDYGKGYTDDVKTTRPIQASVNLKNAKFGFSIQIKGLGAKFIYERLTNVEAIRREQSILKKGRDITCFKSKNKYICRVNVLLERPITPAKISIQSKKT